MNARAILITGLLLVLSACSKLTMENYNKIAVGMHYDEVTRLIGSPTKCDDVMGLRNCTWGNDKRYANVTFAGDKVVLFASSNLD